MLIYTFCPFRVFMKGLVCPNNEVPISVVYQHSVLLFVKNFQSLDSTCIYFIDSPKQIFFNYFNNRPICGAGNSIAVISTH